MAVQHQSNKTLRAVDTGVPPLVVDLDGTLLRTDLLHECLLRLIKKRPWALILAPVWLLRGRAYLKRKLAESVYLRSEGLPMHQEFVSWLRLEKEQGRLLILATASDEDLAARSVAHLDLFDRVVGSSSTRNLKGKAKIAVLQEICGAEFDYAGNSRADHPVWEASREAILVNSSRSVEAQARRSGNVSRVFPRTDNRLKAAIRSLRLYQWVKNLLIFVPAFTSHQGVHGSVLMRSALAFLAFGLCASATYIANDLLDLEEDRQHASKKNRPFASAECPVATGVFMAVALMLAGLGLAYWMRDGLMPVLLLYIVLTTCYSFWLKQLLLLDVLTLAILYTIRVIAGHVVTGIPFSTWLSSFAFFLFLSLAFSKRATELIRLNGGEAVPGRGYIGADLPVMMTAGVGCGFLSSLVLALYINSDSVKPLYHRPDFLWAIVPPLLYYIGRLWIACGRGELDDDPIVYSAKSPSTYVILVVVLLVVVAASVNWF